jgi:hypothetical protein
VEMDARSLSPRNCRSASVVASFKWSQAMSAMILWPSLPQAHARGCGNISRKAVTAANHDRKRMFLMIPCGCRLIRLLFAYPHGVLFEMERIKDQLD